MQARRETTEDRMPSHRDGFTLVELVIALVILSVGILSLANLSSTALLQIRRGQDLTGSALAAQEVIEDISSTPFDSVAAGKFADTIAVGGVDYTVAWSVVDATDSLASGSAELKLIEIFVGGGPTQTFAEQFDLAIYSDGGA